MKMLFLNLINLLDGLHDYIWEIVSKKKTSGEVEVFDLFPNSVISISDAKKYQPVRTRVLKKALNEMSQLVAAEKFQFIDIGCGKGRTSYWAHRFHYLNYTGVDFSPRLIEVAQANQVNQEFDQYVVSDIRNYNFPEGNVVIFIYNPFDGETFRIFLSKISKQNGKAYLIYVNPILDFIISIKSNFKLLRSKDFYNSNNNFNIYEIN